MSQIKTVVFTIMMFALSSQVMGETSGAGTWGNWKKRASGREGSRWTLQEWLDTKNRNAMMDQWLVMNSPSPFEFFLKGESFSYESQVDSLPAESFQSTSGSVGAFAQAIGLVGEYENNLEENLTDVSGLLSVRLMGNSLQTTSLTLSIGQRTRHLIYNSNAESVRNGFADARLQVYITKFFGLTGHYRKFEEVSHPVLNSVGGQLTEGGLFLDFSGVRIFGDWFHEEQTTSPLSVESKTDRTGIKTGLQIFF